MWKKIAFGILIFVIVAAVGGVYTVNKMFSVITRTGYLSSPDGGGGQLEETAPPQSEPEGEGGQAESGEGEQPGETAPPQDDSAGAGGQSAGSSKGGQMYSAEALGSIEKKVSFGDKARAMAICAKALSGSDYARLVSLAAGGVTKAEYAEAYGILRGKLTPEQKTEILKIYGKYSSLLNE